MNAKPVKKYNAAGLTRDGVAGVVDMAEYACLGTMRYPWSKKFKDKVIDGLDGAHSQQEIDERIKAMADHEFRSVEGFSGE